MARHGLKRRRSTRDLRVTIIVVSDDTKTAPAYLQVIKDRIKSVIDLRIVRAPKHGLQPKAIIELARQQINNLGSPPDDTNDCVWALIDLEGDPQQQVAVEHLRRQHESHRLRIAASQPCFEVWTLLHFTDTGRAFNGCTEVLTELRRAWKEHFNAEMPPKAQANYHPLLTRLPQARAAAARQRTTGQSWTEIHLLLESLPPIESL